MLALLMTSAGKGGYDRPRLAWLGGVAALAFLGARLENGGRK